MNLPETFELEISISDDVNTLEDMKRNVPLLAVESTVSDEFRMTRAIMVMFRLDISIDRFEIAFDKVVKLLASVMEMVKPVKLTTEANARTRHPTSAVAPETLNVTSEAFVRKARLRHEPLPPTVRTTVDWFTNMIDTRCIAIVTFGTEFVLSPPCIDTKSPLCVMVLFDTTTVTSLIVLTQTSGLKRLGG